MAKINKFGMANVAGAPLTAISFQNIYPDANLHPIRSMDSEEKEVLAEAMKEDDKNITRIKGYKGFGHGLKCRQKQYKVGEVYVEHGIPGEICTDGVMHFCIDPENVHDFYNYTTTEVDRNGHVSVNPDKRKELTDLTEYCEVEAPASSCFTDGTNGRCFKTASPILKITKKLTFAQYIRKCVINIRKHKKNERYKRLGWIDYIDIARDNDRIISLEEKPGHIKSPNLSKGSVIGNHNTIVANEKGGTRVELTIDGRANEVMVNAKDSSISIHGSYNSAALVGNNATISANGVGGEFVTSGEGSRVSSINPDSVNIAIGKRSIAASLGDCSLAMVKNKESIAAALGVHCDAKGALGSWLVLAEWVYDFDSARAQKTDCPEPCNYILKCVKAVYVDGEKILPDVSYRLEDGEVVRVYDENASNNG